MERYRSGHNEAVLKTVCPQGRVGSNPTLSASQVAEKSFEKNLKKYLTNKCEVRYNAQGSSMKNTKNWIKSTRVRRELFQRNNESRAIWRSTQAGRRDTPGKGAGR